jgi:hypothetical protein
VIIGFIGIKLSGSFVINGFLFIIVRVIIIVINIVVLSFIRNVGFRVMVSFILVPIGLFDSFECKSFRCIMIIIIIIIGIEK